VQRRRVAGDSRFPSRLHGNQRPITNYREHSAIHRGEKKATDCFVDCTGMVFPHRCFCVFLRRSSGGTFPHRSRDSTVIHPNDAYLCIVGADSQWGNWDPASGARLTKESDSVWSLTRRVPRGYTIEFKVTRGSWDTEALYEAGQRLPTSQSSCKGIPR